MALFMIYMVVVTGIRRQFFSHAPTLPYYKKHMNMGGLYVYDWFEAAAAALGFKICTEIFVLHLAPSILRRS